MSDTTSLSSSYSVSAEFAKRFNEAVLVLKRWHLAHDDVPRPTVEEEADSRKTLIEQLQGVLADLAPTEADSLLAANRIPEGVIARLSEKNRDKLPWFISDLRQVQKSLGEAEMLGSGEFATLDEVCDAADATASASFRRLWRR